MAVLVTGGAGYIGSHTVRRLREAGVDTVVLDTLERGRAEALLGAPLVVGSIADESLVAEVCREHSITAVIHFAAHKSVGESMVNPGPYWTNNVQGTVHLIEGMLAADVRTIVFSSSAAVYGSPEQVPITEQAPVRPENVYAETKAMMERVIKWYGVTSGLTWASLRYFNAAGASADSVIGEDWSSTTNLVPLVMRAALTDAGPVDVFGTDFDTPDGSGVRDYIHVEDLAEAHLSALRHLEDGGENLTVNLGTGTGTSVLEILSMTAEVHGAEVPHRLAERRIGDPATVYADSTRAATELGWTATRDLRDIITSAYAWHSRT
ncbi:MAG: UDP-glucose 4-epimerase GalE [Ilumatobacteraceae bacterium]|nr:UDP-glucose 4-epimerase GalE [Ilumatobacteraceae bacterium]